MSTAAAAAPQESPYAWFRLGVSLLLMTIGGSGMYAVTVVLPRIQADFGVDRGDASLPYTLTMIGFGIGGILMGRLADRFGVMVPVMLGGLGLGAGFIGAGSAGNLWQFCLAQGAVDGPARHLRHLRAAGGRHLAVVRPPARHRAGHLHERQLHGRRGLAAGDAALHRQRRLAPAPTSASASSAC